MERRGERSSKYQRKDQRLNFLPSPRPPPSQFGEERVFGFVGDVSDKETAEKFAGAVKDKFGTLDALINNVGSYKIQKVRRGGEGS